MKLNNKSKGNFYTPEKLAKFVIDQLDPIFSKKISILEPSCGDGVFLKAIKNKDFNKVDIVELEKKEIKKAQKIIPCKSFNKDFLDFSLENKKQYDLVIGNPPYIKKFLLSKEQIKKCEKIHKKCGLSDKKIKNIWTSFLVSSALMVKKSGTLAFILPAEILQVNFATEIREFLKKQFTHIEIFTFSELFFEQGIGGQDTVLLICNNSSKEQEVCFTHAEDISKPVKKPVKHPSLSNGSKGKWTESILSPKEIELIQKYKNKTEKISHYSDSTAGIVTGANKFFILSKEDVDEYNVSKFTVPIIQKGHCIKNSISLLQSDFLKIEQANKPCQLLHIPENTKITKNLQELLKIGEDELIHERYKCNIRNKWYTVPSISTAEAFFFKRSHVLPKFPKNEGKNIYVTDSAYRVTMKDEYKGKINSLIYSFYNSFTLSLAEIEGRSYGGGVLEITPNEFKKLHIPFIKNISNQKLKKLREDFEKFTPEEFIKKNDEKILKKFLNMTGEEITIFQKIRKKLLKQRRVKI